MKILGQGDLRQHQDQAIRYALGLGVLPWSPLASGVLSGKYQGGATPEADCMFFTVKDGSHGLQGIRVPDGKTTYAHAPVLAANTKTI